MTATRPAHYIPLRNFYVILLLLFINISMIMAQKPFDIESKLTASDGSTGAQFGAVVKNEGGLALIGAPGVPAVYAIGFNGSFWEEIQKIAGPAGGQFGAALDMDGNYAIVGDRLDDDVCGGTSSCNAGAAYIYKYNGVQWTLVKKLSPDDAAQQNFFGLKVAICGDVAAVSAQYDYNNNQSGSDYHSQGSVYIFEKDAGGNDNWGQVAKFKSADLADQRSDEFGRALDITGDYVIAGSNNTDSGIDQNGSAYIFYRNQNGPDRWGQQTILKLQNIGPEGGNFGLEARADGEILAVGDNRPQSDELGNAVQGSISIYRLNNGSWAYESIVFPTDGSNYGAYFTVSGDNIAVVPNPGTTVHLYRYQEGKWVEKPAITNEDNYNISGAVSLSGVTLICGATSYLSQQGAAYFFEFIATPSEVNATDGKYLNRAVVSWKNRSNQADGFRIYRNGAEIGSALSVATTYNDYDAVPGKIHTYQVSAYNNTWNESSRSQSDLGWAQARGEIRGSVKTEQGAAIKDVGITIADKVNSVGTYLHFNGGGDYVQLPYLSRTKQMTLSAWIRSTADIDEQIIGWGSASEESTIEFKLFPGGRLAYAEWNGSDWSPVTSNRSINDGEWHFVSAVIDNDTCQLYIDGESDVSGTGFTRNIVVTTTSIGAYDRVFAIQQFFNGDIDDVRMWNTARTAEDIRSDMVNSLDGDEPGLVGYWTLDDSTRSGATIAADYKKDGGHHGIIRGAQWENGDRPLLKHTFTDSNGEYRIKDFYFEDDKEFRITPFKEKHLFDPEYRDMAFNEGLGGNADFTDTTSFTVSGRVVYNGTSCGVEGVELLLNDGSTGVFTDAAGEYNLAIEEPGQEYTIKPVLGDSTVAHDFQPAGVTMVVENDASGIDFSDTERHLLYGKVRGGCIEGLGTARLRVTSAADPGCFDTTIVTDFTGNFRLFLPAQKYMVDLVGVDNPDSSDILAFFGPDTADLHFENKRIYFIYHPKPIIQLTVFPDERTCNPAPVPIMQQSLRYDLLIEVLESYGTDTCYVTTGQVSIYDDIGGNPAVPVVLPINNGKVTYNLEAGLPNILGGGEHPYQKLLQIKADVDGRLGTLDQWILVTGHRPRTPTFTSSTPELPFLVIHDPPGDQSYSFQAKGTTITTRNSMAYQSTDLGGGFQDMRFGAVASIGIGGVTWSISSDIGGYWIGYNEHLAGGTSDRRSGNGGIDTTREFTLSLTATEEFHTSESPDFTGEDADVFIGASLNQIFALTDVVDYDPNTCSVVRDTSLAMDVTGFKTTYIYTAQHIRNTVIPQLKQLAVLNPDSAGFFYDAVNVWQQALDQNSRHIKEAKKDKNLSFSGGTNTTYTGSVSKDSSYTIGFSQYFSEEQIRGGGFVLLSVPAEFGFKSSFEWNYHETTLDSTNSQSTVLGYTLGDDDDGDYFSVDIAHDPAYGTPVFKLVAGTSSCPWEPGTQPRDGTQLGINKFVQDDVPPDEPATFTLTLGNTSESGEARPYDLRMVQLSNPDGAIIKVGGVPMGDALSYFIPAGDSAYQATLTVERGPRAYDYDNLQLMMVPPCEFDLYNSATAFADTVTFSVHFASPLSNANLSYPADNWEINPGDPDSLPVVISNYNVHNDYLKNIRLQYRKPNGSWISAIDVPKDQLPDQNLKRYWHYDGLEDGNYELRVVSDGGSYGVRYSAVAKGRVERNALLIAGDPEPSDHILNITDQIAVNFVAGLNPSSISKHRDITLMDTGDSSKIEFDYAVEGNRLIITPAVPFSTLGSRSLVASVANVEDQHGNRLLKPVVWQFRADQHTAYWKSFASKVRIYKGDETLQTAVLYNAAPATAGYHIVHIPAWISLDAGDMTGSIPPGSEQILTFHFDGRTLQGDMTDSVVISLSAERVVRPVSVSLLAQPPAWSREVPAAGSYVTRVYARLIFDGRPSEDELDMAGVFIDNQLSGLGHVTRDVTTGTAAVEFPVYYHAAHGGPVAFRLWDASGGKEYRYYSEGYNFDAGVSIGSRYDPVIIEPNETVQQIPLQKGWNWISFNVTSPDISVANVLKNYAAQPGDLIKGQFGFSEYSAETGWTGSLDVLHPEAGYRLWSAGTGELTASGLQAASRATPAVILPGWNWIGYLPAKPLAVRDALYFVQSVPGDMIRSQDQSALYNNNGEWLGTLHELNPGQSYVLYTRAGGELVYPDLKKTPTEMISDAGKPEWSLDARAYETNMTMIATFDLDGTAFGDTTLLAAAFINGICRGIVRPVWFPDPGRYITFMMIYGNQDDNGDTVRIRVYDPAGSVTRDIGDVLIFDSDARLGSLPEPLVLNALETDAERIPDAYYLKQNYPNPFNPLTTIEYGLPVDDQVNISVFNVLGQKVSTLVDSRQKAGRYKIQFDGGKENIASGIYFYRIHTGGFVRSYKMLLLK